MYFLCPFSEVRMNGWILDIIPVSDFPQLDESFSVSHTGNVFSVEQKFAFLGRLGSALQRALKDGKYSLEMAELQLRLRSHSKL